METICRIKLNQVRGAVCENIQGDCTPVSCALTLPVVKDTIKLRTPFIFTSKNVQKQTIRTVSSQSSHRTRRQSANHHIVISKTGIDSNREHLEFDVCTLVLKKYTVTEVVGDF